MHNIRLSARARTGATITAGALLSATLFVAPAGAADGTFTDTAAADFASGDEGANTAVVDTIGGEVILRPQQGAEFFGDSLPAGWSSSPWNADGGSVVGGGSVSVDGARAQVDEVTGPGHSIEFVATFPVGDPFSHVGFGVTFNEAPWAMFSTGVDGSQLLARTNTGSGSEEVTSLGADLLGTPHLFRVTWDTDGFSYSVDGTAVATHSASVTEDLRPIASEYNTGGAVLNVDWLRMTPYAESGLYSSRIFDAGASATWSVTSQAQTPAGTDVAVQVHTGDTASPDGGWSAWTTVDGSDETMAGAGRYAQYRAALTGDGAGLTPTLGSVTLAYTLVPQNQAPVAQDRAGATAKDTPVTVTLVATDPEGDTVGYAVVTDPAHGALTGTGDTRTYTPEVGFTGTDTFTYRASDGNSASNLATVTITVRPLVKPTIVSFTPGRGPVGTGVKITGTGFLGTETVAFNGVSAPFRVKSDTVIVTRVPARAKSGHIKVVNAEFGSRSSGTFTVTR